MVKKASPRRKLVDAAFALAASTPWRELSMATIAKHGNVPLTEALEIFPHKNAILDAVISDVSAKAMAECAAFTEDDTVRDRLFALLMARFDAMAPYRTAAANIARGMAGDPGALICRVPRAMAAMAQMLEAAGVDSSGLAGAIRTKGLVLVFASSVRVWLHDETEDLEPTMAALDRYLGRADMLALQFCRPPDSGIAVDGAPQESEPKTT